MGDSIMKMRTIKKITTQFKPKEFGFLHRFYLAETNNKILNSIAEFLFEKLPDWFYWTPKSQIKRLSMMIWWAWKMRNSYDWDFCYLYEIIGLKLERMTKEFRENGHCVWNSQPEGREFKRLLEARELANRLAWGSDQDETIKLYEKYDEPRKKDALSSALGIFETAKEINPKLFRFMQKKAWEKDATRRNELRRRFYYLLEKYGESWWD